MARRDPVLISIVTAMPGFNRHLLPVDQQGALCQLEGRREDEILRARLLLRGRSAGLWFCDRGCIAQIGRVHSTSMGPSDGTTVSI